MSEGGDISIPIVPFREGKAHLLRERERRENHHAVFVGSTRFLDYSPDGTNADSIRGREALKNARRMLEEGYQLVVLDAVSSRSTNQFNHALRALQEELGENAHLVIENIGEDLEISPARQQGYEIASRLPGVEYIITSELEKDLDLKTMLQPLRDDASVAMVIPDRGNLKDYPSTQRKYELWGSRLLNRLARAAGLIDIHDKGFDWHNGTRAFRNKRDVLDDFAIEYNAPSHLQDYAITGEIKGQTVKRHINERMWFNAVYAPVFLLLWQGKKVVSVPIHYQHPGQQSAIEEGDSAMDFKRRFQIHSIVPFAVGLIRDLAAQTPRDHMPGINWEKIVGVAADAKEEPESIRSEEVVA